MAYKMAGEDPTGPRLGKRRERHESPVLTY
jgi:hypothetical protein